jgi:TetR/AcrR family transcriptional regulator, cholesterol catabolism regulator
MDTREKILNRASEMIFSFGVKNVTMDVLAKEMGISKRTIYELFGTKDNLVIECIRYIIMEETRELVKIIESAGNVVEAIFRITQRQDKRRKEFPKIFVEDIKKYFSQVYESIYSRRDDLKKFSPSFTLLEKGMKEKVFRDDLQVQLVDSFMHEMISMIHTSDRIRVLNPSDEDILNNIILPYFRGICTQKGLTLVNQYFEHQHINN